MRVKRTARYKCPGYPTHEETLNIPQFLMSHIPGRWRRSKLASLALCVFATAGKVSSESDRIDTVQSIKQGEINKEPETDTKIEKKRNASYLIAPIFIHGKGRGVAGCVVYTPPAFISEDEGRKIIIEMLKREGITIDRQDLFIRPKQWLDAVSTEQRIGFQYISHSDNDRMKTQSNIVSSVGYYNTLKAAKKMRNKLASNKTTYTAAVFYDPMVRVKNRAEMEALYTANVARPASYDEAKEQLQMQVADFIAWMRDLGLIPANNR